MTKKIIDLIKNVNEIDLKEIEKKIKDFSFDKNVYQTIDSIKSLTFPLTNEKILNNCVYLIPEKKKQLIEQIFGNVVSGIYHVQNFSIGSSHSDIHQKKRCIVQDINEYEKIYGELTNIASNYQRLLSTHEINRAKNLDDVLQQAQVSLNKIKNVEKHAQEAASKTGVVQHAKIFEEQANSYKNQAWCWGGLGFALIIVAVIYVIYMMFIVEAKATLASNEIVLIIIRFFILSVGSTALFVCIKNFYARMHLTAVNRHRANCMKTFQIFIDSTNEEKTKNAILDKATTAIFNMGKTGYLSSQKNDSLPSSGCFSAINIVDHLKTQT